MPPNQGSLVELFFSVDSFVSSLLTLFPLPLARRLSLQSSFSLTLILVLTRLTIQLVEESLRFYGTWNSFFFIRSEIRILKTGSSRAQFNLIILIILVN